MNISFSGISWIAVLVSLLFSFVLGALWHSKLLFGESWAKDSGTPYNKENHGNPLLIFGLSAVSHLVALVTLAAIIGQGAGVTHGVVCGLVVSLAWISTSLGVTYIFAGRSLRLFLIDAGFYIVFCTLSGLIIGFFQ